MPIVTSKQLESECHLLNAGRYDGNRTHPKHRFYEITDYQTLDGTPVEAFFAACLALTAAYNSVVEPRHRIRTPATSYFFTFPSESFLTPKEKTLFATGCKKIIGWDSFGIEAWHNNIITDGADYNLISPTLAQDGVPVPRRLRMENVLAALRSAADHLLDKINEQRAAENRPLVRTALDSQILNPDRFPVERELAAAARAGGKTEVSILDIPSLCVKIGMSEAAAEPDINMCLHFPRRRRSASAKKHDRHQDVKIPVRRVLQLVNLLLGRIPSRNISQKTNNKPDKDRN